MTRRHKQPSYRASKNAADIMQRAYSCAFLRAARGAIYPRRVKVAFRRRRRRDFQRVPFTARGAARSGASESSMQREFGTVVALTAARAEAGAPCASDGLTLAETTA
jgi:hypothetical protein